ncbi:hypothetical protein CBR_g20168 [Chara braunii]|uniref:Protein kinase domain-containing protein n=1 Tax=Chara braunii TaxID=69332 RepID=A0A388KZP9_CHABU|nr:hypothetical protein CBR_g20168 [Chara braunii]|eukprot:GBG75537.1 hypothetical protein CBR_g20168 [Chara braunii]
MPLQSGSSSSGSSGLGSPSFLFASATAHNYCEQLNCGSSCPINDNCCASESETEACLRSCPSVPEVDPSASPICSRDCRQCLNLSAPSSGGGSGGSAASGSGSGAGAGAGRTTGQGSAAAGGNGTGSGSGKTLPSSGKNDRERNPSKFPIMVGGIMAGLLAFGLIMAATVYVYYVHLKKDPGLSLANLAGAGAGASPAVLMAAQQQQQQQRRRQHGTRHVGGSGGGSRSHHHPHTHAHTHRGPRRHGHARHPPMWASGRATPVVDRSQAIPLYSRSNVIPLPAAATASTSVHIPLYSLTESHHHIGPSPSSAAPPPPPLMHIYPISESLGGVGRAMSSADGGGAAAAATHPGGGGSDRKPPPPHDRVVHVGYPLMDHRSFSIDASVASIASTNEDYACIVFNLILLQGMTRSFSTDNLLGAGRYGNTFRGTLVDGSTVVVKRITRTDGLTEGMDFIRQVEGLAMADDMCLAKLWGCCVEAGERALVYEYIPLGSLETMLHGNKECYLKEACQPFRLGWLQRLHIATAIAKALDYLHRKKEAGPSGIVHGNLKPSNILMDEYMRPRLIDYGIAFLALEGRGLDVAYHGLHKTEYQAPDYLHTGRIESASDVYSYGVILLELISGKRPFGRTAVSSADRKRDSVIGMARRAMKDDLSTVDLVDKAIAIGTYEKGCVRQVVELALECASPSRQTRPALDVVIERITRIAKEAQAAATASDLQQQQVQQIHHQQQQLQMMSMSGDFTLCSQQRTQLQRQQTKHACINHSV